MKDTSGTKEELIQEISDLKKKVKKLEKAAAQHKPIEKELHTSELKFRQLAEDMPALICTFLPDSTLTYVNTAYCKLFSKSPDELVGQKFFDFLPDDATRKNVKHQYMSLTPENPVKTYEHKVIVADGTGKAHWHRWTDHAFFKDNGEISHFQSIGQDITESKKAEDALKESELKYRSYIENAPNGVFIVDENGRYLDVNPSACSITGYSHKELLAMSIPDLVPPDSRETAGNHFRKVVETGYAHGEFTFLHKHNQIRYWSVEAIRLSATRFMGFVQDITERKQAEAQTKATLAALRESEASLAEAQRIARIGSWDWDMISNTVKWSKEMYRVFGISPDSFDGNPESLLKVIHPDDSDLFTKTMKSNLKKGNPTSLEFRVIYKSGSIHHIFAAGRVEFNKDGRPVRNIGTAQDITERKQAEEELQESEFFLKTLLNSIPIPVFYKDREGRYLGFNKAFETFFGATKEKLIGKTVFDINPPDLAAIYNAKDNELFESGGVQQYTSQVKDALGALREVIFNKAIFTNSYGEISGQIGAILDITDHKQTEIALQNEHWRLESIIEGINVGTWEWNVQTGETVFSDVWAQIIGYTLDELKPISIKTWEKYSHPDDLKHSGELLERHFAGELPYYDYDCRMKHKDGYWVWVQDRGRVITRTADGKPLLMFGTHTNITERKQAEDKLKESEEKYRNLVENANEAIFVAQDGQLVFLNPMTPLLLGYSGEELVSRPFVDFVYPDDRDMVIERHIGRLKGEAIPPFYTFRIIHKDGGVRWVELNAARIKWKGKPATLNFLSDITARKQSEVALRQSEEKFSKAFQTSPYAITITRPEDGKLIEVNDTFISMTGLTREEALSSSTVGLQLWVSDEDRKFVVAALSEGQAIVGKEYQFRIKNGKIITGLFSAQLVKLDTGRCILSSIDDITNRRRVEEELREAEKHYRSLVEGMPGIAYMFSKKHGGVYYSSNVTSMLGYTPEQLYAQPQLWHNSIHPDDLSLIEQVIRETDTGKPFCVEYRIRNAEGNWHWFEDRSFGYKLDGEDTIIEGLAFDITDRKQAKEEKSNLEAQLFQSQKMEAIGTLAGGIAHDFNNILAVIIGYTELARDKNQKQNKEQYLQETLNGAQRAKNLVKQILAFSRQDGNEKKPLDIKVLLKEAVKFLRSSIPATVEINQQLTAEECNIMADPTQMHQVIMNLCTNASHAMKETGGILKIELADIELAKDEIPPHPDLQAGHYIKLSVSDTGYGIDPDNIRKIFDPFFTTKSKNEGTGLGLSVVYGIVKGHGGVINVYSEQGKGAAFHVYLPRIIQTETKEVDAGNPVIGGTERILFVDDEPSLVDIGMRMLFPLGYHVTGATSSPKALELFQAGPQNFDLVITDMTLPKMTGIDLSRKLLQIRPDIPIILCSGVKEHETEAQAKSLGIKAYLTKPLTRRELAGVMREVLGK